MGHMSIDRRNAIKLGGIGALSALGACALSGCAGSSQAHAEPTPLTEEERIASISDPIYMGAATNASGQTLTMGTGKYGQIANQAMIDKHVEYTPKLHQVSPRVYCAVGNGLSNSTMIVGDSGIIVVDTNESMEAAQFDLDLFRTVTDKPVVAVVYTHDHYVNGTELYLGEGNPTGAPIIAHEKFIEVINSTLSELNDTYVPRALMMFGALLPLEGEDGSVGGGIGPFYKNPHTNGSTAGFIAPDTLIPDVGTAAMTPMDIDGVRFEFYPMVSDSPCNINIYLPDEKVALSNTVWPCFFNMYTLRGAVYRDPSVLTSSIDTMVSWAPDAHVGCHGVPIIGADAVKQELMLYRDCIQFVYDQTIRHMNKGMGPDEIVEAVHVPRFMLEGMCTKPLYGEVEHYIRGVYRGTVGWFGTDPLELHPIGKKFESERIVEAMGGEKKVLEEARRVLEDKQYAWAATLATYLLAINPDDGEARAVKADAFRKIAQVTYATNTRHYYMTNALAMEGQLDIPTSIPLNASKLGVAKRTLALDLLRVSIDYEKAEGVESSLAVTYTDEGVTETMLVRNCVGQIVEGAIDDPAVELNMAYPTMCQILAGKLKLDDAIASGDVEVAGSSEELARLRDLFERKL